jgi:uncharacterized hydrophobic protein (TIGR00271 family)
MDDSGIIPSTEDASHTGAERPEVDPAEEIRNEITRAAAPTVEFYMMNLFAAVIASYGLLANSPAVVIGAMVIAVLLGPIRGIGLALISGEKKLLLISLFTIMTGAMEVLGVSLLIGLLHSSTPITPELLSRTNPNLFDLMIALGGGAAGAYALGRKLPGGTIIGVAIATALVPPLASCAIAASHGSWILARGAFLLFFTNFIAIQCAYSIVLYALRLHAPKNLNVDLRSVIRSLSPTIILVIGTAIFLGVVLERRIADEQQRAKMRAALGSALLTIPGASLDEMTLTHEDSLFSVVASVRVPEAITPEEVRKMESSMRPIMDETVHLTIQSILTKVADHSGYLYQPKELEMIIKEPQVHLAQFDSAALRRDSLVILDSIHHTDSLRTVDSVQSIIKKDSLSKDSLAKVRHVHKQK